MTGDLRVERILNPDEVVDRLGRIASAVSAE